MLYRNNLTFQAPKESCASVSVLFDIAIGVDHLLAVSPAFGYWILVIMDALSIEQFSDVVCIDPALSQPDREVVIIKALADEFRIGSCSNLVTLRLRAVGVTKYHMGPGRQSHWCCCII